MEEHLSIFDDIYSIKDNISDEIFLKLNNKVQKLISELKECKAKLEDYDDEDDFSSSLGSSISLYDSDSSSLYDEEDSDDHILPEIIINLEASEFQEETDETNDVDLEEESEIELEGCHCSEKWIFPSMDGEITTDLKFDKYFCLENEERMKNCENFKKFIEKFPLLNNLFAKQEIPFIDAPMNEDYDSKYVSMIIRIFLSIISKLNCDKHRSIMKMVLYDYMIRNSRFLVDNQNFTKTALRIFDEFIEKEPSFVALAVELNVNYTKWQEIFNNIVIKE